MTKISSEIKHELISQLSESGFDGVGKIVKSETKLGRLFYAFFFSVAACCAFVQLITTIMT